MIPTYKGRRRDKRLDAAQNQGRSLDFPQRFAPDCPPEERDAAVAALDELQRSRPLKPPRRMLALT